MSSEAPRGRLDFLRVKEGYQEKKKKPKTLPDQIRESHGDNLISVFPPPIDPFLQQLKGVIDQANEHKK